MMHDPPSPTSRPGLKWGKKKNRSNISATFDCFLPRRTGYFSSWLLRRFFSGIRLDEDQLSGMKALPPDAIVVYITKHKSEFEYLFYHTRHGQLGTPVPEVAIGYGIKAWQPLSRIKEILQFYWHHLRSTRRLPNPFTLGYFEDQLKAGTTCYLSLIEKKGFYRRFVKAQPDPLALMLKIQRQSDTPIFLVPQLMFFSRKPDKPIPSLVSLIFGSEQKPGRLRRLVALFKSPGKVFVEISEPVNLGAFIDVCQRQGDPAGRDQMAAVLRRRLLSQLDRHRQSITGPQLKSTEELKEQILTTPRLQQFMAKHSHSRDLPLHKVRKEADSHLEEIAAKYNPVFISIAYGIVRWIINTMFDGVTVDQRELNQVKAMSQKGPLVLVPCHKSHIDYIILSYILHSNNMPCPHVAAGKNLSFWPMGPLFRRGGAFFIRRTFRGAVLYAKVFSEYVYKLLQDGFNIEFFIEGGRSRTGKLILPKLGLLSIMLNAYKEGACQDLIFTPIYVGYDQVLEEDAYLNELEGGKKESENLSQVIRAHRFLKKRYGRIYIKFNEQISFRDLLDQQGFNPESITTKEQNILCRNLGYRIINAINEVTVVTPHAVVAAALLNTNLDQFTKSHLTDTIETYIYYLEAQQVTLADTLLIDPMRTVDNVLENYQSRKFIEQITKFGVAVEAEPVYRVVEARRPALEYYSNNTINFFVPAGMTAMGILEQDAFQFAAADLHVSYRFLQEFFKYEFAFDADRPAEYFVRKTLKIFIDDAILMPHPTLPDTYNLTSVGFRKLKNYASFLKPYLESYLVTLRFLIRNPKEKVRAKDCIKKINARGIRMFKRKSIQRRESISKINYQNALEYFNYHAIRGSEDLEKAEVYQNAIQKYLDLIPG
jgi:glycerol-3-phosphate O-acyltransferase